MPPLDPPSSPPPRSAPEVAPGRLEEPLDGRAFGPGQPCFGCSPDHPHGFRLAFVREGDALVTRFTPGEERQGPPGIMHGGLVSTLADELAAWTVLAALGKFGFTAKMTCQFHLPVRIGAPVEARGRITRDRGRVIHVEILLAQGGERCLTGEFVFAVLDEKGAERLLRGPIPEQWRRFCR